MVVQFEKEVISYLNLPSLPKRVWNGKDSFQDGVAVLNLSSGQQSYAVCTFDKETDKTPRIKKVFGIEPFSDIENIFIVPSYMDNDTSEVDLDAESKKRAEQLAAEANELENEGVVDEAIEKANKLPEWIFDEIHNRDEAIAWLKQYNRQNGIKKGKVPTNEETIKMRLYNIYMSQKNHK
jgi:hypothetical protein